MQLQKATIAELDKSNQEQNSFPVQFNPTTLKLTLNNRVEGNQSPGRQVTQSIGSGSTTLALDLIFDTADEGSTESPRSVREKTKQLEHFLLPKGTGEQENAPPRMRFTWGDLIIDGLIDNLAIDFDHFAANGLPLRAKVSLSIRGQDRAFELQAQNDSRSGATAPGAAASGGLGISLGVSASLGISAGLSVSAGISVSANVGVALGGESAAEFAARAGVDSAAWRGLELGGESSLSLSAGAEIGFSAGLNASAGLGVTLGVEAGASASLEASFGLEADAGLSAVTGVGTGAGLASGFALSSAGGVTAAIESVQTSKNQAAEESAREAFKAPVKALPAATARTSQPPAAVPGAQPKPPAQSRTPLKSTGLPSVSAQQAAPPAPRPPRADPRASSFGYGAPLRPTIGEAVAERSNSLQGGATVKSKIASGEPPVTSDPTTPPWVALPARDRARRTADNAQTLRHPSRHCGCAGHCKH